MPTTLSSGLGTQATSHPWSPSSLGFQRLDVMGVRELGRLCQQMSSPWTCTAWSLQDGPLTARPSLVQPKDGGPSGPEELWKVTWSPRLLVLGFPPPASFRRVTPPTDASTLSTALWQGLGFVPGRKGRGWKYWDTSPWASVLAHSTHLKPSSRTFPKPLIAQVTRVGQPEMLLPCFLEWQL